MFEEREDAERYCLLLEAQDFPTPTVEIMAKEHIDQFCHDAGYQSRLVERGFIPKTQEDRLLIAPPERNIENKTLLENDSFYKGESDDELEEIKQKLEKLL